QGPEALGMARTIASLPAGSRITDYISLGVIAKFFPAEKVHEILQETNRASIRERDLPAHVVVYSAIALALYMRSSYREVLRCLLEGVQWLLDPSVNGKVAGNSGISQARSRLGAEPLQKLYAAVPGNSARRPSVPIRAPRPGQHLFPGTRQGGHAARRACSPNAGTGAEGECLLRTPWWQSSPGVSGFPDSAQRRPSAEDCHGGLSKNGHCTITEAGLTVL
ncbi:MAG: transposase domain-containing protein, partial [Acidobacteria bacterium]|nr:transposase domain-containing protein [Bryobacteraceae bacterium CoA2 C42]